MVVYLPYPAIDGCIEPVYAGFVGRNFAGCPEQSHLRFLLHHAYSHPDELLFFRAYPARCPAGMEESSPPSGPEGTSHPHRPAPSSCRRAQCPAYPRYGKDSSGQRNKAPAVPLRRQSWRSLDYRTTRPSGKLRQRVRPRAPRYTNFFIAPCPRKEILLLYALFCSRATPPQCRLDQACV